MPITVNTNMSSLICQRSLGKATNGINTALQRMSTGLRINSSKDDAAGYAISSKLNTKISSYNQSMQNTQDGVSYLQTADGTLGTMEQMLSRMRDLAEKSANGTYGQEERNAMQAEVNSLAKELSRIKDSTEFNGIKIFEADFTGVSADSDDDTPIDPTKVTGSYKVKKLSFEDIKLTYDKQAIEINSSDAQKIANGTMSVVNGKTYVLAADNEDALQKILQGNKTGKTFLTSDINMKKEWTAVGNVSSAYKGVFNGNGYTISGLNINQSTSDYQGIFGYVDIADISNIKLDKVSITGKNRTGGLAGFVKGSATKIKNCSVNGFVKGENCTAGLIGEKHDKNLVENCDVNVDIVANISTGDDNAIGGLIAYQRSGGTLTNCFSKGSITASGAVGGVGGFIGKNDMSQAQVLKSYSDMKLNITSNSGGKNNIGGFIGLNFNQTIVKDCKAMGTINLAVNNYSYAAPSVGGFIGYNGSANPLIENCYTSVNTTIENNKTNLKTLAGGFCGYNENTGIIKTSYSTGSITLSNNPTGTTVGGFISKNTATITDCFWDTETSKISTSAGGTGKTTKELTGQTGFKYPDTWTASNWTFLKNSYPQLSWEPLPPAEPKLKSINLQVGINSDSNSVIKVTSGLAIKKFNVNIADEKSAQNAINSIDKMLSTVTNSKTNIGANLNRLDSVLDFQTNQIKILSGANSLIKDADIAKESASYIKNQILQQTTSTLLATANQNPSIALSLI